MNISPMAVAIGAVVFVLALLVIVAWSLCVAAARADRMAEEDKDALP
jgi:hypothetical protein